MNFFEKRAIENYFNNFSSELETVKLSVEKVSKQTANQELLRELEDLRDSTKKRIEKVGSQISGFHNNLAELDSKLIALRKENALDNKVCFVNDPNSLQLLTEDMEELKKSVQHLELSRESEQQQTQDHLSQLEKIMHQLFTKMNERLDKWNHYTDEQKEISLVSNPSHLIDLKCQDSFNKHFTELKDSHAKFEEK